MIRKQTSLALAAATLVALAAAGCQTTDPYTGQQQPNRTGTGALIGAGIGIAAGLLTGDSAVDFPVNGVVTVTMLGAGQTTLVAASGVTITGKGLKLAEQYAGMQLIKTATNTWRAIGSLSA